MTTDTESTEIITLPPAKDLPALFTKDGGKDEIESIVKQIEERARSETFDHETAKGRKAATSLAAKVSSSKVALENARKKATEDLRAQIDGINGIGKSATTRLEALRDEIKAPVKAWEDREAERVKLIQQKLIIFDTDQLTALAAADEIKALIARIDAVEVSEEEFAEFEDDAEVGKREALKKYRADLQVAEGREEQERELAELRRAAAEREEADRKAAEEKAAKEAEAKAEEERAAEAKRAQAAAEERHAEELAAAERRAEEAAQRERDRIAEEERRKEAEREKVLADEAKRARIRDEIKSDMGKVKPRDMNNIVDAMIAGQIRHVKVLV